MTRPSEQPLESVNPATADLIARHAAQGEAEIERALVRAVEAARVHRVAQVEARAALLGRLAGALRGSRSLLASLAVAEMGKPLAQAEAEVDKCALCCDHFAAHGPSLLAPRPVAHERAAEVRLAPLGVVLGIMPWNYPYWQVIRFAAAALVAGNAVLVKHAPSTTLCALALCRVAREAGLPEGLLEPLVVGVDAVPRLIADRRVAAVTITGSSRAGAAVAALAGASCKKVVLELGGSDPFIVLADADVAEAARVGARSRFQNAGQSCIAAKRFLAHRAVAGELTERLIAEARAIRVGDPASRDVDMGPLARIDLAATLEAQVVSSVHHGARIACGGGRLEGPGAFFAPTVLVDVPRSSPVFREETFGPVAPVVEVGSDDEAVALANDSDYGLGATVFTADVERARALADRLDAGTVAINGMVVSDPRLPFGGIKQSGHGRELSSFGVAEFCNIKSVVGLALQRMIGSLTRP